MIRFVFLLAGALVIANAQTAQPQPKPDAAAVARGRSQFTKSCAFCHGANATGGTEGPNLTLSAVVRHDKNGDTIGAVIREGRPAKGMPAIPLEPSQIADVVAYLHARIVELDRRSAGRPPSSYALERLLTGDAQKGKAFFEGPGQCSGCHSTEKDLAHIAKRYPPVELQARFLYPPNVHQTATVVTKSGERIEGELAYADAFTIALTMKNGWYRSWPRDSVTAEIRDPLAQHRELLNRYSNADVHNVFAYLETLK